MGVSSTGRAATIPLPRLSGAHGLERRGDAQRAAALADDAALSLAELFTGGAAPAPAGAPSELQFRSVDRLLSLSNRMVGDFDPSLVPSECLSEISGGCDYRGNPSTCVALDEDLLSLPIEGVEPRPLSSLLGPLAFDKISALLNSSVLPINEGLENQRTSSMLRPYSDLGIRRSKRRYHRLLRLLIKRGIIDFGLECITEVWIFYVNKKGGLQRLVIDCRTASCHFEDCPHTALPTASCFSRLELGADEDLFFSQFDRTTVFYQMSLPAHLRPYFCLDAVQLRFFPELRVRFPDLPGTAWIRPRFAVVPMGWSMALFICQNVLLDIAKSAYPTVLCLDDHTPIPDLSRGAMTV
jgi:hypothetical protein